MENIQKKQMKPNKAQKKPIKIKYISSPMMVQAKNASEFRAIVQQLTGKNSNLDHDDHEDQLYHHVSPQYEDTNFRKLGEFAAAPGAHGGALSCWFSTREDQLLEADQDHNPVLQGDYHHDDRDHNHTVSEINHVDENYSNSSTTSTTSDHDQLSFLADQIDDQAHFWRSEIVLPESSFCEFQYPCVFVG